MRRAGPWQLPVVTVVAGGLMFVPFCAGKRILRRPSRQRVFYAHKLPAAVPLNIYSNIGGFVRSKSVAQARKIVERICALTFIK